uniref:TLDc domain-containing protein n=1 Tax=Rhizophagus irregularis (strain DAOM 181602 / DAOM 197198 / MUCL 43194) TaxID=747089 RepID=U9T9H1_RHIID
MSFEYSQELANDYEKLFETDEGYDVIIYAGDNENVKEIHAFSNILRIRSQYFRTVYLLKLQGLDILKLLSAVDEFKIQRLIICIQEYLTKHQHECLQNNPVEILETVYQRETFTDLWNYYVEKICDKPDNIPYNFNLLYRASRDGNTTSDFYTKCDNKGATIVIAKITNSNQIVGGYISLHAKVGYSNDVYSVLCRCDFGPIFGLGGDLIFKNNRCCRDRSSSYPDVDIPVGKFETMIDYEVFQVVVKKCSN